MENFSKKRLIELMFIILIQTIDALCILIYKYLNEIIFINIFLIGCLDGFFYLLIYLLFELFFPLFNIQTLSFFDIIIRGNGLLNFILSLFTGFVYYFYYFKIIYLFYPCYISRFYVLMSITFFTNKPIALLMLLFGVAIYLEIIILNFCNLNENTEKNIINKAKEKTLDIDNISKSECTFLEYSLMNEE